MRIGNDRLGLDIAGRVHRDGMRSGLRALFTQAQGIHGGQLLMRIGELQMTTAGAIGVELAKLTELVRLTRQFDRCGVISSKDWIRKMGEIEGAIIPGLEVRSFRPEREADALAWLVG